MQPARETSPRVYSGAWLSRPTNSGRKLNSVKWIACFASPNAPARKRGGASRSVWGVSWLSSHSVRSENQAPCFTVTTGIRPARLSWGFPPLTKLRNSRNLKPAPRRCPGAVARAERRLLSRLRPRAQPGRGQRTTCKWSAE